MKRVELERKTRKRVESRKRSDKESNNIESL